MSPIATLIPTAFQLFPTFFSPLFHPFSSFLKSFTPLPSNPLHLFSHFPPLSLLNHPFPFPLLSLQFLNHSPIPLSLPSHIPLIPLSFPSHSLINPIPLLPPKKQGPRDRERERGRGREWDIERERNRGKEREREEDAKVRAERAREKERERELEAIKEQVFIPPFLPKFSYLFSPPSSLFSPPHFFTFSNVILQKQADFLLFMCFFLLFCKILHFFPLFSVLMPFPPFFPLFPLPFLIFVLSNFHLK